MGVSKHAHALKHVSASNMATRKSPVLSSASDDEAGSPKEVIRELSVILQEKAKDLERIVEGKNKVKKSKKVVGSSSQDANKELLERANKLQKRLKQSGLDNKKAVTAKTKENDRVWISVCQMKEVRPGWVRKSARLPIEIEACRSDTYDRLLRKAIKKCKLSARSGMSPSLFRMNGTRLLNESLVIKGKEKEWTLGSYLQALKKSPHSVKLGVAFVSEPLLSSSSNSQLDSSVEDDKSSVVERSGEKNCFPEVLYLHKSKLGVRGAVSMRREDVWLSFGKRSGDIGLYHPESDNYFVSTVSLGEKILLAPLIDSSSVIQGCVITNSSSTSGLTIVWQSPQVIEVSDFKQPVVLYCISNVHSYCTYTWTKLEVEHSFVSSTVIYVKEEGLYKCTVSFGTQKAYSNVIDVSVKIPSHAVDASSGKEHSLPSSNLQEQAVEPGTSTPYVSVLGQCVSTEDPTHDSLASRPPPLSTPRKISPKVQSLPTFPTEGNAMEFRREDIAKATNNFSKQECVGEGGFGCVYRGHIHGTTVAVKILKKECVEKVLRPGGSAKDMLKTEMNTLSRCRHRNIVELMGFCVSPPALVYEFMENGTLYFHLHGKSSNPLTWAQRCKILKDVCRAITWLHCTIPTPLIHGDIKSQNILLDIHLNGKLGDFGFARELPQLVNDRSMVSVELLVKSAGYSAPELDACRHSPKTDVYAYGVVCLETYTGQKAFCKSRNDPFLTDLVDEQLKTVDSFATVSDPTAGELAPYLLRLLFRIIPPCFLKHRSRMESKEVMNLWLSTNF